MKRVVVLVAAGISLAALGWLLLYKSEAKRPKTGSSPASAEPELMLLEQLSALPPEHLFLVDARGSLFFKRGHIPRAINIAKQNVLADLPKALPLMPKDQNTFIVVYCSDAGCDDATFVAREILRAGSKNVFVYQGGWEEWHSNSLPEENG